MMQGFSRIVNRCAGYFPHYRHTLTTRDLSRILRGMQLIDQLLAVAGLYAEAKGISLSRLATIMFNDGKKFDNLETGADITTGNFERAMIFFAENWPDKLKWPKDIISRPSTEDKPWSNHEERTLRKNYSTCGPQGCVDLLPNRTFGAIYRRAQELELSSTTATVAAG